MRGNSAVSRTSNSVTLGSTHSSRVFSFFAKDILFFPFLVEPRLILSQKLRILGCEPELMEARLRASGKHLSRADFHCRDAEHRGVAPGKMAVRPSLEGAQ